MSRLLLTVVVPTVGRDTLSRTLASIRRQANASEVEIVVVGDTHAGTYTVALKEAALDAACNGARYVAHDGGQHCVGHPQRQYGMEQAHGAWLAFSQDDAVWRPGAWGTIRAALDNGTPCPRLFRVEVRPGVTVWQKAILGEGQIDADCIVTPNDPARLGRWGLRYSGDYDFIAETVALWSGAMWCPQVIAQGRP